jgi:lysophospholipase L1-like esterase
MFKKSMQMFAVMVACVAFMPAVRGADDAKPYDTFGHREAIRMVCIGDSITQAGAYVNALQTAFGKQWEVTNLGNSGATLLKKGDKPYNRLPQFAQAIQRKPDVVSIALGTNDSKPGNWSNKADFEADYKSMIDELKKANRKVVIYCCVPPPAGGNKWGINGSIIKDEVGPLVRKVAKATQCYVIDLQEPFNGKNCIPDGVHPNVDGHLLMAAAIYKALTGKPIPAESPAPPQ